MQIVSVGNGRRKAALFCVMVAATMQILGLSESTPRTESRLRALLWPTIRSVVDLEYIARQGFWICFLVAVSSLVTRAFTGRLLTGLLDIGFFFLAGVGVRERNRFAGVSAFAAYLLWALVTQRFTGQGFGVIQIVFLALLLSNVRGNWMAAHWQPDQNAETLTARFNDTIGDKLSDQLPLYLWPKVRVAFYVLAALELLLLLVLLFIPTSMLRQ